MKRAVTYIIGFAAILLTNLFGCVITIGAFTVGIIVIATITKACIGG